MRQATKLVPSLVVAIGLVTLLMSHAEAQVLDVRTGKPIPLAVPCIGVAVNGMQTPVRQMLGSVPAWAMTTWEPDGLPKIIYGTAYFQLPPLMRRFTSLHECGHASTQDADEYAANCWALRKGKWSPQQIAQIRRFHKNLGPLPPQYGGSGAAFWAGTAAECPDLADD